MASEHGTNCCTETTGSSLNVQAEQGQGRPAGAAQAHKVVLPWRRQDKDPATVEVIVVSEKTGTRVRNVIVEEATRESGSLVFEAIDGPGIYFVYYLPYAMLGKPHYPQAQYLPSRPSAEPAWAAAVGRSAWAGGADAGLPTARVLRYEAASERDSFAPMNFTARADELEHFRSLHAGEAFLVFPEDRLNPVSMHSELPAHWVMDGPSDTFHGTAQAGEDYVVQLGLYAQKEIKGVSVDVVSPTGGHCINTDGVDRLGKPWHRALDVPAGMVRALFVVLPIPADSCGNHALCGGHHPCGGGAAAEDRGHPGGGGGNGSGTPCGRFRRSTIPSAPGMAGFEGCPGRGDRGPLHSGLTG